LRLPSFGQETVQTFGADRFFRSKKRCRPF